MPELARGKTGRVVGHLMGLLTLMKGQPLAYNKDNQEDKEPLFDTVDTLNDTLRIFCRTGRAASSSSPRRWNAPRRKRLRHRDRPGRLPGEEGPAVPRRPRSGGARGEGRAGRRAATCRELSLAALQRFNPEIGEDVYDVLSLRGSLDARNVLGGTAPAQVRAQAARHRVRLSA